MQSKCRKFFIMLCGAVIMITASRAAAAAEKAEPFLPSPVITVSTIPPNGDVNPYGVAFVPTQFPTGGALAPGDILVSNFNNNQNLQGTGTTIVRIRNGAASTFFEGQAPLGLSTALKVLKSGYVLVGNFPSADGTCATAQDGSILVINSDGMLLGSIINNQMIVGPWDAALHDSGSSAQFFIANALNGRISRLNLTVGSNGVALQSATIIASGYQFRCDPAAFVDAPTGLVYDAATDTLYVASTLDNAVFAVPEAGKTTTDQGQGTVIYQDQQHLHGALAMCQAPNGHLLVSNSDIVNGDPNQPSEIVEFTTSGQFVKELPVDPNQGGAFGLGVQKIGASAQFAAVDDNQANIRIWSLNSN
jgi:hypothetical protein